jgi:hypothetical protein
MLSFKRFPGVWILCADVSEHCQKPRNHPKERMQHSQHGEKFEIKTRVLSRQCLWLRLLVVNSLSHHWPWVQFAVYITCWTVRQFDRQTCCNLLQTDRTRSWTLQTVTTVTLISMFRCNSLSLSWPVCTQVPRSACDMSRYRYIDICATRNTEKKKERKKKRKKKASNESDFKTLFLFKLFHLYRQVNRTLAYTSIFTREGFIIM